MHHILTLNSFNFNERHFLQTKGCAMGTIAAPSYATIYMGRFETLHIYPDINRDYLFYARYIDDIFLIYTGENAKLTQFLIDLNTKHDSIKCDYETSTKSIAFLDTLVYIDQNSSLQLHFIQNPPIHTTIFIQNHLIPDTSKIAYHIHKHSESEQ